VLVALCCPRRSSRGHVVPSKDFGVVPGGNSGGNWRQSREKSLRCRGLSP
jgi:hypothetical protein